MSRKVTASMIIIGDEILSGRTKDANLNHVALWLGGLGISLMDVRVIPDVGDVIVDTVNECRAKFDYVFTTGGIGPTHDDITAENVARAFGVPLVQSEEAVAAFIKEIGQENFTPARARMTMVPEGATLVKNPVSIAPGFQMENVFVMAGIPLIMQAMLLDIEGRLEGGAVTQTLAIHVFEGESFFADVLGDVQGQFDNVSIGSYPFVRDKRYGAVFVLRSTDVAKLEEALAMLKKKITDRGSEYFEGELP